MGLKMQGGHLHVEVQCVTMPVRAARPLPILWFWERQQSDV